MDDGEQEQQLEYLTEEELGEVPVVLSERDDKCLHGVSPSVLFMIVVSHIIQTEAGHSPSLKLMPQKCWQQKGNGLQNTRL